MTTRKKRINNSDIFNLNVYRTPTSRKKDKTVEIAKRYTPTGLEPGPVKVYTKEEIKKYLKDQVT